MDGWMDDHGWLTMDGWMKWGWSNSADFLGAKDDQTWLESVGTCAKHLELWLP
jgi:hypothetical protein